MGGTNTSIPKQLECGEFSLKNATKFLDKKCFCDIEIFCDETSIGIFHKIILASQCSYFEKVLNDTSKTHKIVNLDQKSIVDALRYLYGENIEVKLENAFKLLKVCNLFEIDELVELCKDVIVQEIPCCDALKVREYLVKCDMQDTVSSIDQIIFKNFNEIVLSSEFDEATFEFVDYLTKSNELMIDDERDIFKAIRKWIAYDYTDRRCYVEALFMNVKVPLMSMRYINEVLDNDPLINSIDSLKCFVNQSICYILNNETRPMLKEYHFSQRFNDDPMKIEDSSKSTYRMVFGGKSLHNDNSLSGTTELSSECHGCWTSGPNMHIERNDYAVASYLDDIYVLGGRDYKDNLLDVNEVFQLKTSEWKRLNKLPIMPIKRADHSVVMVGSQLIVTGGITGKESITNQVHSLDVSKDNSNWISLNPMLAARSHHFTCLIEDHIYAIGGSKDNSNEAYNMSLQQWKYIAMMNSTRIYASCAVLGKCIYAVGGQNHKGAILSSIECYNCFDDRWTSLDIRLPIGRSKMATFTYEGEIYICGGMTSVGYIIDSVDKLDIEKKRVTKVGNLNQARYMHKYSAVSKQIH